MNRSPLMLVLLILIPCVFCYQIATVLVGQRQDLTGSQVLRAWNTDMSQQQCLRREVSQRIPQHDTVYVGNGSTSLLAVELAIVVTPQHPVDYSKGSAQWILQLKPSSSGCEGLALQLKRTGVA